MSFLVKAVLVLACALMGARVQAATACESVQNYQQVLTCAEQKSPDVLEQEALVRQKSAVVDAVTQLRNPELGVQSITGSVNSETRTETDVSLAFPVELGGKRAARKEVSEAELSRAQSALLLQKQTVRKMTLLKLLRLRQITSELELIDESSQTFTKLVKQYESRPALSPEQQVTLTVFRIARGEYSFKRMEYDEELTSLEAYFKIATGLPLEKIKQVLPPKITKWPIVRASHDDLAKSPLLASHLADVQSAQGELNQAKGESWPTMMIGPSAKFTSEGGQDLQQWGANLSMPIPVFNVNGAGRTAAAVGLKAAEQKRDLQLQQLEAQREGLRKSYAKAIEVFALTPNESSLSDKHKKIEGLFMKGVVSSPLIIEAHRSLVDFEKLRNERELHAVETYLDIQMIDGEAVELAL
ncbi:TolC family protein [Bdellovibrio sp. NC01]|uniref:TolC family protein n=1 Tax=Bdellovibrio sp. NC01 TaxID=2220073 RepID=UPI001157E467|nr:TolC family protein [Bdellovibrio sp. NC01]QDK38766.1 hypothetical protein DOE51_14815 [Bdellovibrio sp. NC01]